MPIKNTRIFTITPWEKLQEFIKDSEYSSFFVLCDQHTQEFCLAHFQSQMSPLNYQISCIPCGETIKNLDTVQYIWNDWLEKGIDRNSLVLCLGGGVVCDIGGFCANTILRGVDCIYIPTSLMAMSDASIGGKTGINFQLYKNQIGSFSMPKAIVIDPVFLQTLPHRELKNGYVEVIKHSLIQSPPYFQDLLQNSWPLNQSDMLEFMKKSIRTKTEIVEQDYKETGLRKCLNFGHTIGHALESLFLSKAQHVLHGEAIAAGMICESYVSSILYKWRPHVLESIQQFLKPFTSDINFYSTDISTIFEFLEKDKKKKQGIIYFSLLESPGKPRIDQQVSHDLVLNSLEYYCDYMN